MLFSGILKEFGRYLFNFAPLLFKPVSDLHIRTTLVVGCVYDMVFSTTEALPKITSIMFNVL